MHSCVFLEDELQRERIRSDHSWIGDVTKKHKSLFFILFSRLSLLIVSMNGHKVGIGERTSKRTESEEGE